MRADGPLVAVVDDEDAIRKALKRLLRSAGLDVETFASGTKFLNSLAARKPACVLLDIRMQGVTGFDVQARLKADNIQAPIVFMTALDDSGDFRGDRRCITVERRSTTGRQVQGIECLPSASVSHDP